MWWGWGSVGARRLRAIATPPSIPRIVEAARWGMVASGIRGIPDAARRAGIVDRRQGAGAGCRRARSGGWVVGVG